MHLKKLIEARPDNIPSGEFHGNKITIILFLQNCIICQKVLIAFIILYSFLFLLGDHETVLRICTLHNG